MARPPASLEKSRIITTAVTTFIWWLLLYGTGVWVSGGSKVTHVVPTTMATATLITYLFIPYFATHSVLMGGLRGVLNKRILLPDDGVDAGASAGNAWRAGAINALAFGAVPAVAGFLLASSSTAELSARQFAVRFATGGAVLAAIVAFVVAGRPLLAATRVPRGTPRFDGDPKPYLWGHFVVPHAFTNFVINAALAFSLSPVPFAGGTAKVPAINVVIDSAITFLVLTWIIGSGVRSQARTEAQWGIAPSAAAVPQSVLKAVLTPVLCALGLSVALGFVLSITHTSAIGIYAWALYRGIAFGGYAAWIASRVAPAAIHGELAPVPAAMAVQQSAA